jgi:two-component system CheB/CheR fusion protein
MNTSKGSTCWCNRGHLRQSPTEVTTLADDLMIHVTGFFRDPDTWKALYEQAIVPLVESRDPGGPVRAWVSACSSGEEAYSLAMLLVEESDRTGKRLDIKVFATGRPRRTKRRTRVLMCLPSRCPRLH